MPNQEFIPAEAYQAWLQQQQAAAAAAGHPQQQIPVAPQPAPGAQQQVYYTVTPPTAQTPVAPQQQQTAAAKFDTVLEELKKKGLELLKGDKKMDNAAIANMIAGMSPEDIANAQRYGEYLKEQQKGFIEKNWKTGLGLAAATAVGAIGAKTLGGGSGSTQEAMALVKSGEQIGKALMNAGTLNTLNVVKKAFFG